MPYYVSDGDLEVVHFVLYGCETLSCTLREKHRPRVFGKSVLKRVFGPKKDEVTGEWKRLHNEELYSSPNIVRVMKSRKMRWAGHVDYMGAGEVHKGRRPLARRRCIYENNNKIFVQEVEW
jgi:hypothetical protein